MTAGHQPPPASHVPSGSVTWVNEPAPVMPASARLHWEEQTAARCEMLGIPHSNQQIVHEAKASGKVLGYYG